MDVYIYINRWVSIPQPPILSSLFLLESDPKIRNPHPSPMVGSMNGRATWGTFVCTQLPFTSWVGRQTHGHVTGVADLTVIGSVDYFTPRNIPFISRWNKPLILTIDPYFLGHPSDGMVFSKNNREKGRNNVCWVVPPPRNSGKWRFCILTSGFKYFWNFPPDFWGNDPIWRVYFSKGLVQPPTRQGVREEHFSNFFWKSWLPSRSLTASLPLKSCRVSIGSRIVFQPPFFRVYLKLSG